MAKSTIPLQLSMSLYNYSSEKTAEIYVLHTLNATCISNVATEFRDKRLQKALTYIREHCRENITLQTLADLVNMSVEGIKKLIIRGCNKSFKTIQFEYRIAIAMEMLANTDELISNIAYDCGYSCTTSFGKNFREYCGMTAGEFRKIVDRYNREHYWSRNVSWEKYDFDMDVVQPRVSRCTTATQSMY